ncbi:response regulator transcription factor [Laceyella putida]|uniref:Response regulator transcription factor n=1 Tax=Laceyella putida TaxID=110101 RepID=A0ABW2RM79_9BACL
MLIFYFILMPNCEELLLTPDLHKIITITGYDKHEKRNESETMDMTKPSILIVDDEEHMIDLLTRILKDEFNVTAATDGKMALGLLKQKHFDLCLLDIMMPSMNGWDLLKQMKHEKIETAVIYVSARAEVEDRVEGLELGADDYITKPFDPTEVVARVKSVLRRTAKRTQSDQLYFEGIRIDLSRREVWVNEKELKLTPTEFDLLITLAVHPKQAFSRDQLLEKVWGFDFCGDTRTVDTHIKNLRIKFRQAGLQGDPLQTVWGFGYKWGVL